MSWRKVGSAGLTAAVLATLLAATAASSGADETAAAWNIWGRSVESRPIAVRRSGDPASDFKMLVVGSVHGDEPQGIRVVDRIDHRYKAGIKGVDLWTIRTLNPDGTRARTRGNAHGVDLNRNFPYRWNPHLNGGYESGPRPLSEPESKTIERISRHAVFDIAIFYHQPWHETLVPCNRSGRVAVLYSRLSGLRRSRTCNGYSPGSAINWLHHRFGTAAFVVELGPDAVTKHQLRRHARATVKLARYSVISAGAKAQSPVR